MVTPSGGAQTTEDSTGTLQFGGGPQSATGSSGTFFSAGGAPVAASGASAGSAQEGALPTAAQPLSLERQTVPLGERQEHPLAAAARPSTLPFTGLELGFVVLLAFAALAGGYGLRRSSYTAA